MWKMGNVSYKYPIRYRIENGAFTQKQLEKDDSGGCDSIIIHSIMGGGKGEGRSEIIISLDGKTNCSVDDIELFKSWIMTAKTLSESDTLSPNRKKFALDVFEAYQKAHLSAMQ